MRGQLIDGHYHFSRTSKTTRYDNLEEMLQYIRSAELEAVCVHNIVLWETKALLRNPLALLAKLMEPQKVYAFGGVMYPDPEEQWKPYSYREQAERLLSMGFDGVKVQNKPLYKREWNITYDHENFDDFWAYLEQENVPIMFHIGDPKEFWDINRVPKKVFDFGWYYDQNIPPYETYYQETERILQKFPGLNLTIPHFYFLSDDLKRCEDFMERYPNVKLDITPGGEMYFNFSVCQDAARAFFLKYYDRILFGTDNHGGDDESSGAEQLESGINKIREMKSFLEQETCIFGGNSIRGLYLPQMVLEHIYKENFVNWVGTAPRQVDGELAEAMVKEISQTAVNRGDGVYLTDDFEAVLRQLSMYVKKR